MISLKNIITESIFDSLMDKWSMTDDKNEVEKYIDRFKILKNRNFITGKDSDISLWFNKSFQEFKKYIDEKDKSFQQIVSLFTNELRIDRRCMAKLEDLKRGATCQRNPARLLVTVIDVKWYGSAAVELTYKDPAGKPNVVLLYRDREPTLEIGETGRPWSFDGDGKLFRLVSEAHRINLAHLFDPLLAIHTSMVDPAAASDHCRLRRDAAASTAAVPPGG